MFWLYILIGVLVVVVFIVCNLSEIEVDEDETMSHISFGNFILRKFDNFDEDC